MTPESTAQVIAFLLFFALLARQMQNPGYRCPSCNATSAREHTPECSWSKHYGEGL